MANGMAAVLSCMALFSCSSEDIGNADMAKASDNICFGISAEGQGERSACPANEYTSRRFVMRAEGTSDTLCVRTLVSEGIRVAAGCSENRVAQRGTCVTQDSFYTAFQVVGWKANDPSAGFYLSETVTDKGNNTWSGERTYYWPGAGYPLQFHAWAPVSLAGPENPQHPALDYTVPNQVADQSDIVVASPGQLAGNYNARVPLTFQHVCTAVRFVTGMPMQPGEFVSVALKGVKGAGTYDLSSKSWTLKEGTQDFTLSFSPHKSVTGTEQTDLTDDSQTFLMLPQTLPDGAVAEVVFVNAQGTTRTLTASLVGTEWPMGTTVTYRLSITPEYDLEFKTESPTLDAHYVMYPIEIHAGENIPGGNWILEVTGDDKAWATLKKGTDLMPLEMEGYWIDNDDEDYPGKRTQRLSFSENGTQTIYVFLEENCSDGAADRSVTLSLYPASQPQAISDRLTVTQTTAEQADGYQVERVEETAPVPWGFAWKGVKEEFRTTQGSGNKVPPGQLTQITAAMEAAGFGSLPDYITVATKDNNNGVLLSIDYSQIAIDIAKSETDGYENTLALYNYNGIRYISALKNFMASLGNVVHTSTSQEVTLENPLEFAALSALKKNKFHLRQAVGEGAVMYIPELNDEDANWYLPAIGQLTVVDAQWAVLVLDGHRQRVGQ